MPIFKKALKLSSDVFTTIVIAIAFLLIITKITGIKIYNVVSGSMEPTYHAGSLIFVRKVDPFSIKKGQVITFMLSSDSIATHRVKDIVVDKEDTNEIYFITKGDANKYEDGSPVYYKNVIGTPLFSIAYLGYIVSYLQNPYTIYILTSLIIILIVLILKDIYKKKL